MISGHYCLCFGDEWENWKTGNEAENVDEAVGEKRSEFGRDIHLRELEVSSPLDYEVYLRLVN